jgi:hypothetical protein
MIPIVHELDMDSLSTNAGHACSQVRVFPPVESRQSSQPNASVGSHDMVPLAERLAWSVAEFAAVFGCCKRQVWNLVKQQGLPLRVLGPRTRMIYREDVDDWFRSRPILRQFSNPVGKKTLLPRIAVGLDARLLLTPPSDPRPRVSRAALSGNDWRIAIHPPICPAGRAEFSLLPENRKHRVTPATIRPRRPGNNWRRQVESLRRSLKSCPEGTLSREFLSSTTVPKKQNKSIMALRAKYFGASSRKRPIQQIAAPGGADRKLRIGQLGSIVCRKSNALMPRSQNNPRFPDRRSGNLVYAWPRYSQLPGDIFRLCRRPSLKAVKRRNHPPLSRRQLCAETRDDPFSVNFPGGLVGRR